IAPIFRPGALNRQPRGASAIADGDRPRSLCDFPRIPPLRRSLMIAGVGPRSRRRPGRSRRAGMAHELGTCGQRDRLRVNIADAPALNSWCAEFGCTPIQLRHAVGRVGVMAADVSAFLEREAGIRPLRRPLWSAWLRPARRNLFDSTLLSSRVSVAPPVVDDRGSARSCALYPGAQVLFCPPPTLCS